MAHACANDCVGEVNRQDLRFYSFYGSFWTVLTHIFTFLAILTFQQLLALASTPQVFVLTTMTKPITLPLCACARGN